MLRFSSLPVSFSQFFSISHNQASNHRGSFSHASLVATILLLLGLSCLVTIPALAQCGTVWTGPASGGLWNVAGNWSGGVPTASTNVCIDNGNAQASAVTLNISGAQAANLTIDT